MMMRNIGIVFAAGLMSISAIGFTQTVTNNWNTPQKPFQVYGNTYYVGTQGLASILITSKNGHILIDGTLSTSAPQIVDNVRALGFRIEDVKLILNTHVHYDHAGGIAQLQKLSGAHVAASAATAEVMRSGKVGADDPQFATLPPIAPIANVSVFKNGETLTVGKLAVTAHLTPGHTPGGTSWTWESCVDDKCLHMVYADSLNPIASGNYKYSDPKRDPNGAKQLRESFEVVSRLPCDILLTPHPELVDVSGKLAKREQGAAQNPFIDTNACRAYAEASRDKLDKRIEQEKAQ